MNQNSRLNTPQGPNREVIIDTKREMNAQMCLSVFLAGLREPMGSMIRAMAPASLPLAFSYCLREQNILYMKKNSLHHTQTYRQNQPPIPPRNSYRPPIHYFNPTPHYQPNTYTPKLETGIITKKPPPIATQPNIYYNHRPFTRQNLPNNPPPRPRRDIPMDTSSITNQYKQPTFGQMQQQQTFQERQVQQYQPPKNFQFQQIGPPPRIRAKELFNIQSNDLDNIEQELYYQDDEINPNNPINEILEDNYLPNLDYEIEDGNFYPEASQQSDT